ncbi:MAG: ATP synthase F0 subunit C [Erysipelotrichaceae bacterium]|nr:ATP synthase F0 subunit C [Erysipelotrichaceae bacterium]
MELARGLVAIGAGLAIMTGMWTGIGQGLAASKAVEAVGKNPEAVNEIRSTLILGCALAETCAIYGMLISILLIFVFK